MGSGGGGGRGGGTGQNLTATLQRLWMLDQQGGAFAGRYGYRVVGMGRYSVRRMGGRGVVAPPWRGGPAVPGFSP
jgi:hypothetical protein